MTNQVITKRALKEFTEHTTYQEKSRDALVSVFAVFAAVLASCINTLFLLVADNSKWGLNSLQTKAAVTMNVEGLEKLISLT